MTCTDQVSLNPYLILYYFVPFPNHINWHAAPQVFIQISACVIPPSAIFLVGCIASLKFTQIYSVRIARQLHFCLSTRFLLHSVCYFFKNTISLPI